MLLIFLVIWLTFSHVRKIEEYAWHGAKHVPETRYKIIFEPLCSGGRYFCNLLEKFSCRHHLS